MHHYLIAAAVLFGAAGIAQAQQPATTGAVPALAEIENEAMVVEAFGITVDQLEDTDIFDRGGERIGEVDEVLMNPQGQIAAVSAEVGGFLGIGDKEVVLDLGQLRREGDRLLIDLTKEQVEALPAWDD